MRAERSERWRIIQSYRNLIASGFISQLAMLDVYFTIKASLGGAV
jgi:hypothetical protein